MLELLGTCRIKSQTKSCTIFSPSMETFARFECMSVVDPLTE